MGMSNMKNNKVKLLKIGLLISFIVVLILVLIAVMVKNAKLSKLKRYALSKKVLLPEREMQDRFSRISESSIKVNNKLISAFKLLQYPTKEELDWLPRKGKYLRFLDQKIENRQQINTITSYINKNRAFIEKIREIENIENTRPVVDVNNPDYHDIDYFCNNITTASFLFYIVAENAIIENAPAQAMQALTEIARLKTATLHNPFVISHYEILTNTAILLDGINRVVNGVTLSDSDLQIILEILNKRENELKQNFQFIMQGATFNFCQLVDKGDYINAGSSAFWAELETDKKTSTSTMFLSFFGKISEKEKMLEEVIFIKNNLINYDNFQLVKEKWGNFATQYTVGENSTTFNVNYINFSEIYYDNLKYIAYIHTQKVIIASLLYKRKYKSFPDTIKSLSPEYLLKSDLIDPYNGKMLCSKKGKFRALIGTNNNSSCNIIQKFKECSGLRIYSVGQNGKNQGGRSGHGVILQDDKSNDDITSILITD
jgi:hypothetical protein